MLKSILKLNGAQELSKKAQKEVNGGGRIKALCAPEPPVCSEDNPNCQELQYYQVWCVNR